MFQFLTIFLVLLASVCGETFMEEEPMLQKHHVLSGSDISFSKSKLRSDDSSNQILTISLNFDEKEVSLDVELNYDLIDEDTLVHVFGEDDKILYSYKPEIKAYRGVGENSTAHRISVLDYEDKRIKGKFVADGEIYFVNPIAEHADIKKRNIQNGHLVIYKATEVCYFENLNGTQTENLICPGEHNSGVRLRDDAGSPSNVANCPQSPLKYGNNVLADWSYYETITALGEDVPTFMLNVYNMASAQFEDTINVYHYIKYMEVRTVGTGWWWNKNPCRSITEQLNAVKNYRVWMGSTAMESGGWHLLAGCRSNGQAGVAQWRGVCKTEGYGNLVSTYNVVNWWQVPGHEMGHHWGSDHTTDGLMWGLKPWFDSESQQQMCLHYALHAHKCLPDYYGCTPKCSVGQCGGDGCGGTCGNCDPQFAGYELEGNFTYEGSYEFDEDMYGFQNETEDESSEGVLIKFNLLFLSMIFFVSFF